MDIFHIHMQGLCCHLREYRVSSLPDLRRTDHQLHAAILIEYQPGTGNLQCDRPHTCLIGKERHSHTTPDISGLIPVRVSFLLPVNVFCAFLQTREDTVGICSDGRQVFIFIISMNQILFPKFQRIHSDFSRNVIHEAFT